LGLSENVGTIRPPSRFCSSHSPLKLQLGGIRHVLDRDICRAFGFIHRVNIAGLVPFCKCGGKVNDYILSQTWKTSWIQLFPFQPHRLDTQILGHVEYHVLSIICRVFDVVISWNCPWCFHVGYNGFPMGHGQRPGSELVSTEGVKDRLEQLQMLLSVMERASRFGKRQGNWVLIIPCFFVIQDIQYEIWWIIQ